MTEAAHQSRSSFWSFSVLLMIALVLSFAGQQIVVVHFEKPYDVYLGISGYGMKSWHLWELITYQFLHSGWVHLLVNLALLWFLGRTMEARLGKWKFLLIYQAAVVAGAVLQGALGLGGFLLPESMESTASFLRERFGETYYGSSVGLCGLFAVFCLWRPAGENKLCRFLPMPPALLFWIVLGLAVLPMVLLRETSLALLAHLGGLLTGAVFAQKLNRTSGAAQKE